MRLIAEAAWDDANLRPGMVSVVQTATDLLEWSPHIHSLVTRGGWRRDGTWVPVPYVDAHAAELLFRHQVIAFLRDEELLGEERIDLLLAWQNSGFSVHNAVTVGAHDAAGTERLARYLLRPSLSLAGRASSGWPGMVTARFCTGARRAAASAAPFGHSTRWTSWLVC